jgi:DNA replication protein DnaC
METLANKITAVVSAMTVRSSEEREPTYEERLQAIHANRIAAKARDVIGRAAIPKRFSGRTLESFIPRCEGSAKALSVAKEYAENFGDVESNGRNLIMLGGVGAGKTHLSVGIANHIMATGKTALFTSVIGAVRSIKETYRRDSEATEGSAIRKLCEPDLLILDEVGVQFGTDAEKIILFEIINGRYEDMKPTVIISNLNIEGLTEYLGERVIDRLREGGGKVIMFNWASYRRSA